MSTVLICDDHRIVREGLHEFIRWVPGVDRVLLAKCGEEVLARYPVERPNLILMDVRMPGIGGLEATRRLLGRYPEAIVLMLSAADDPDEVAAAVGSGARGYLLKDVSHEELCTAVGHALDGEDLVGTAKRQAMIVRRDNAIRPQLTQRELQVLRGMSEGRSNAQIGRALFLSEDTVKTHARRLFRKLEVSDRAQAVALGFRRGLVS